MQTEYAKQENIFREAMYTINYTFYKILNKAKKFKCYESSLKHMQYNYVGIHCSYYQVQETSFRFQRAEEYILS